MAVVLLIYLEYFGVSCSVWEVLAEEMPTFVLNLM